MNEVRRCDAAQERLPTGMRRFVKSQQLELIGHRPHMRRDGMPTEPPIGRGPCAVCGEPFEQPSTNPPEKPIL